tara:strand:+ start:480 stop:929 length:450 start_codon:yes stop_codon:yes gene_type:complete
MPKKRKQPAGLKKYWADKKKKANKRKTTTRKRRTTKKNMLTLKRKKAYPSKSKSKSNKPRKKSNGMKLPKIPSVLKKVALGLGAASLAGMAVSFIAPQFAPIARPIAALAAGGIPGVAGELIIDQGLLGNITSMFNGGGINQQRLASGL